MSTRAKTDREFHPNPHVKRGFRSGPSGLRRHDAANRLLFAEAVLALAFASVVVRLAPFRWIVAAASQPARAPPPPPARRAELTARVRWAVGAASRRAPWRAVCLQQGLAAQWMLRRRGVAAVLYYGAAPNKDVGLRAHVWVKDGETDVVGTEAAQAFAIIAQFPPPSAH